MIPKPNTTPEQTIQNWHTRLAIAGTALGMLITTLAGAWAEARWPNAAGTYVTVMPQTPVHTADILWQLRRLDGVHNAFAVFRGDLTPDEIEGTGWLDVWFYANQTDTPELAFLPPNPMLSLQEGHLPAMHSPNEAVLGYELAQALRLEVGDTVLIRQRALRVVGIWGPSAHFPGNFAQISSAAAEAMMLSSSDGPHHFVVLPAIQGHAEEVANRVWRTIPEVEVLSPSWELARVRHEHAILSLTLGGAVMLNTLLSLPLVASLSLKRDISAVRIALLSGLGGLVAGWMATVAANLYASSTLGLTPLHVPPRLAIAVLAGSAGMGLLARRVKGPWSWPMRYVGTALVLALCTTAVVTLGSLNEALNLSLSEAQHTARDWVTLPGVQADGGLLRDLDRVPGIRGYVIEAYGGLANEDETRWLGPSPSSGVLYSTQIVGGEGALSVPYHLGYWRGRPLNPDNLNEAIVGYDLAQELALQIGDAVEIRGVSFTVVGIRERLRYDPRNDLNHRLAISLEALRRVLHQPSASGQVTLLIPPARSQEEKGIFLHELGTRLNVGSVLTIEDRLAQMALAFPAAWSLKPADARQTISHARISYAITLLLCSVLFLAAGALAVGAAMMDRLTSDERRVGLLRALGANEGMLLGDYLQIASVLGVAGALPGVVGGWAISTVLNQLGPSGSAELLFTPRLGASVFFFVVLTAMVAAVAPVSRAIRQDATWTLYSSFPTKSEATSVAEQRASLLEKRESSPPATGKVIPGGSES
jgi:hypothetical protein